MSTITPLVVGGIPVNVYRYPSDIDSSSPIYALFVLHGRSQSTKDVEFIIDAILDYNHGQMAFHKNRDLIVLAFDHRNHGRRLIDARRNEAWHRNPARNNPQHAVDMYSIQTGTALDVSFIMDHIASHLYPMGERTIVEWGIVGFSLGGHSTWIALAREPRLRIGIPIVGCPDYAKLIAQRAQTAGVPFAPPYYPEHLRSYVDKHDPASCPFRAKDWSNPFLGKRILILSAGKDTLVPWSVSKDFAEGLYIGDGVKRVVVEENAGHECTPVMIKEIVLFIQDWLNGE